MYAMILFEDDSPFSVKREYRFAIYVVANLIITLSYGSIVGLGAKIANDWFPENETTMALVAPIAFYYLSGAISAYYTPKFVHSTEDLYIVAYIYLLSSFAIAIVVLTCIQRSSPKVPPSHSAMINSQGLLPLRQSLLVVSLSGLEYIKFDQNYE